MITDLHSEQLIDLQIKYHHQMLIHDFVKEIMKLDSIDEVLWSICQNIISGLGFEDCVIYLLDDEKKGLVQKAAYGPKSPSLNSIVNQITIPIGKGVVGTVAATGIAEIIKDTSTDERYIIDDDIRLSEIAVPIIYKNIVIGVIDSEHPQENFYDDYHLQMLSTIASLCSTKIGLLITNNELKRYKNHLEEVVKERTIALKETVNKLAVSNSSLERYAHMVSHDLKSPLRTISSFLKLIEQKEQNLSATSKEYMGLIYNAVGGMEHLLKELLDTSVDTNNQPNFKNIDLNIILDNVLRNLNFELEKNKVEIELKNNLPKYRGIQSHFIQIFQNIISNSVKYRAQNRKQKVIISCESKDDIIQLKFQDFGIGLCQSHLESIFNLGERQHFASNGNGIGLHTCKKIIEQYNGKIIASSAGINQGLTITIDLPFTKL